MIKVRENNGQAAVEAVVSLSAVVAFTALLLFLIYFCVLKTNLHYLSHEFLVCREISNPWVCETKFKKATTSLFKFGSTPFISAQKFPHQQRVTLKVTFPILRLTKVTWKYEDSIALPLKIDSRTNKDLSLY